MDLITALIYKKNRKTDITPWGSIGKQTISTLKLVWYSHLLFEMIFSIYRLTGSRTVTVADKHEMHFTQSFLLEVQRLGSTVCNTLTHTCTKDSSIQGHIIPAGEYVALGPCYSLYPK